MKLIFKLGYIHILVWLIKFKEHLPRHDAWRKLRDMYHEYWQLPIHINMNKPEAREIVEALKKL